MKDLIVKQTAALTSANSMGSLTSRISDTNAELLDAVDNQANKILKDILRSVNKLIFISENTENNVAEIKVLLSKRTSFESGSNSLNFSKNITNTATRVSNSVKNTAAKITRISAPTLLVQRAAVTTPGSVIPKRNNDVIEANSTSEVQNTNNVFSEQIAAEQASENMAMMQKQINLLQNILDVLGGDSGKSKAKQEEPEAKGGILQGIFKSLIGGILKTGLIGLVGAASMGLINGFKAFFNGSSFGDALIAGLGGFLEFLTFGLFDKESVKGWLDSVSKIWDNLGTYVNQYLVEPFNKLVDNVKAMLNTYIVEPFNRTIKNISTAFNDLFVKPLASFVETITRTFDEYFVQPVTTFTQNIQDIFSKIYKNIKDFASKIPGLGNLFATDTNKKVVLQPEGVVPSDIASSDDVMVTLPDGTVVMGTPEQPKTAAEKARPPSAAVVANSGTAAANAVYGTSATNAAARDIMAMQGNAAPVIVSAPTTNVENKQNIAIPQPIRNPDMAFNQFNIRNRIA